MSVTAAKGFVAGSVAAGFKASGALDLTAVVNRGPEFSAAAVFTSNRAQANPIIWSRQVIQDGRVGAIVLNSGGANCFTGAQGFAVAHGTAESAAENFACDSADVLVCSTGLIGVHLDLELMRAGLAAISVSLEATVDAGEASSRAIMTTDTRPKTVVIERDGWRVGGMAKGAGMLAPGLATMLVVLTTDASVDPGVLDAVLRSATAVTFDRIDSDGCMSTNDQVTILASGASAIAPSQAELSDAVTEACAGLASQLHADAEGASHEITIKVFGAKTEADAVEVGRSVARNNLFKAAIFGNDPNWGRVLAAIGTTRAVFDPYDVDVFLNGVRVCHAGEPDRARSEVDLSPRTVELHIGLNVGSETATILTNDLTHDYVHENSAYSS